MVKLYTRQCLHTTTQLLQGFSEVRAKIWSNYTQDKAYILQHSYSKAPVELEPKFGPIIHKTKPTYYSTALPDFSGVRAKIWSNYTQDKAYILQHSYSKASVKLEPKFGQIIHKTKPTYYNTATPRLQLSSSQNLVKLYTRQSLHTTFYSDIPPSTHGITITYTSPARICTALIVSRSLRSLANYAYSLLYCYFNVKCLQA